MVKRIFALATAIILLLLVVVTFIFGITGSDYFLGMLFLCMAVPILIWAITLFARLFRDKGQEMLEENEKSQLSEENKGKAEDNVK